MNSYGGKTRGKESMRQKQFESSVNSYGGKTAFQTAVEDD